MADFNKIMYYIVAYKISHKTPCWINEASKLYGHHNCFFKKVNSHKYTHPPSGQLHNFDGHYFCSLRNISSPSVPFFVCLLVQLSTDMPLSSLILSSLLISLLNVIFSLTKCLWFLALSFESLSFNLIILAVLVHCPLFLFGPLAY